MTIAERANLASAIKEYNKILDFWNKQSLLGVSQFYECLDIDECIAFYECMV